jgi:hypothetical protein
MQAFRSLVPAALLLLATIGPTGAGDKKVLVPGDPPLTPDILDDYARLAEWHLGPALARVGGKERLAQLVVNDWKNGDKARQKEILAAVQWWREEYPKLGPTERERLAGRPPTPGLDPERGRMTAQEIEAIHRLQLQMRNNDRQEQIRALSNLQAEHHELMKVIINNMRPSGRYVYNPSTGRYDRWVAD